MTSRTLTGKDIARALRDKALSYPDVEQSIACKGTALECTTVKIKGKAFLFVRDVDARLKVDASRAEVAKLASKQPDAFAIGATGWATIKFGASKLPALGVMEKWLEESYQSFAEGKGKKAPAAKTKGKGASKR
ncbi:MAG: hypothetical protein HY898_36790 [Deltaproteobacteria bacterium]|nr:hypothetical protein [Deltaproteobacteria bacterium]